MIKKRLPVTNQYVKSSVVDDRNHNLYNDYLQYKKEGIDHIALRLSLKYGISTTVFYRVIKREKQKAKREEAPHVSI